MSVVTWQKNSDWLKYLSMYNLFTRGNCQLPLKELGFNYTSRLYCMHAGWLLNVRVEWRMWKLFVEYFTGDFPSPYLANAPPCVPVTASACVFRRCHTWVFGKCFKQYHAQSLNLSNFFTSGWLYPPLWNLAFLTGFCSSFYRQVCEFIGARVTLYMSMLFPSPDVVLSSRLL